MNDGFEHYLQHCQERVQVALEAVLTDFRSEFCATDTRPWLQRLAAAMRYSLNNGGKRIRPLLVYAAAESVSGSDIHPALDGTACAVECIHAYSLIHDDLPAMDDDDLRRGHPTCHRQFDEATAILAGDALQAAAYELIAGLPQLSAEVRLDMSRQLAAAAGARGMVGGQAIDLEAAQRDIGQTHLEAMHRLKTGALIRAAVTLGAQAAGADPTQRRALETYGEAIGLCFQVQDDILDVIGDTTTLGKRTGADQARNKPTYVSLLGLEPAGNYAAQLQEEALAALRPLGADAARLRQLAGYILNRRQ